MFFHKCFTFWAFSVIISVFAQDDVINGLDSDFPPLKVMEADGLSSLQDEIICQEKVKIQIYYECLCPDCRNFDTMQLVPTVQKLSPYLDIHTYPFGNAKIIKTEGGYDFQCQHGPEECYGNKLHACAKDIIGNVTESVFFNACMMESSQKDRGSNDAAADVCGESMNIDTTAIKECAKGAKGTQLLKYYGDESKKVGFDYVPYILVNGVVNDGNHFMRDVCAAFVIQPPPCSAGWW